MTALDRLDAIRERAHLIATRPDDHILRSTTIASLVMVDGPAMEAALRKVLELHEPQQVNWSSNPRYKVCSCGAMSPCPTVRAIEDFLA